MAPVTFGAKPGRPRKPTVLKRLQGTDALNPHRINRHEPVLKEGRPPVPEGLSREERRAFDRFAKDLSAMHVLTPQDGAALQALAVEFTAWQALNRDLRDNGRTYKRGSQQLPRPEVRMARDAGRAVNVLFGRFGLTPADRACVETVADRKRLPEDEFRAAPGKRGPRAPADDEFSARPRAVKAK